MPGSERPDAGLPRPPAYRGRQVPAVLAVIAVLAVLGSQLDSPYLLGILGTWLLFSLIGVGFYLVFGVGGEFAFSHGAFVGIGAYVSAWATQSAPFPVGLAAATLVGAAVAAVLMLLLRRAEEFSFAIATLAFGFIAVVVFREWEAFTGPAGEVSGVVTPTVAGIPLGTPLRSYLLVLAVFAVGMLLAALIERSPLQREALANRDNATVAATLGVPTLRLRMVMFTLGSAYAAAGGSLLAHRTGFVGPDSFGVHLAIDVFLIVLLGGIGSMWGPLLGAAFVVLAPEQLRFVDQYRALLFGALLVGVIIAVPEGLIGVLRRSRRLAGRLLGREG